jgi:hypothetical protein
MQSTATGGTIRMPILLFSSSYVNTNGAIKIFASLDAETIFSSTDGAGILKYFAHPICHGDTPVFECNLVISVSNETPTVNA